MLRHGSLRFFRLLIGHCREDLKVLVVAVIEHDQKLIVSLDAGLIDLLNGLQAGEQDRVMRRAGKIIMERAVVFKNGQDITGLDGSFQLAEDALQNGQLAVGALLDRRSRPRYIRGQSRSSRYRSHQNRQAAAWAS